jgi:hypothetical protein
MPQALGWLATARGCFADECGTLPRGLLTSAFALVVGLERVFHLDEMNAVGFAVLTGGCRGPSREAVGGWRRHLRWYEVDAFCRRTDPGHLLRGDDALVRFDEHAIPRWTRKFRIRKGYVTPRNKDRRCEKLFFASEVAAGRFLSVRGTPGHVGLADRAVPLLEQVLACSRPRTLHALFDAGAGKSDADVRALWDLAERLEGEFAGAHVRTLRRKFFKRPGQLDSTPEALLVYLGPFTGQEALVPGVDQFNAAGHRVAWLENRRVVISLTPRSRTRAGP